MATIHTLGLSLSMMRIQELVALWLHSPELFVFQRQSWTSFLVKFYFLCILGTSWTEDTNFTCLQKIYVSCHSSSVLTSGNHGSQFLYRLQSNIALKMEKVPPFSYADDCFTNQFCFWIFKRLKQASRYMTLSSTSSSPITLETMTSSAMRSQREHRSFSEDWKVIKIQRELDDEWCLIFDLYRRP